MNQSANEQHVPIKRDHCTKKRKFHFSNHQFSGDILVFKGVIVAKKFQTNLRHKVRETTLKATSHLCEVHFPSP